MSRVAAIILSLIVLTNSPAVVAAAETVGTPPAGPGSADGKAVQPAPAPKIRVGYVDMLKIAEQSDIGKTARTHFEAKADRLKARIETKQKLLEKQKANLEAKFPSYTPEQRAAKIRDYEKKVDELRKMIQDADKELKPLQEAMAKDIYNKIEQVAREYASANGLFLVLEKRELLYQGIDVQFVDVTEALISILNKK